MKGALARLGIRGFKPELRKAPQKLAALSTPEGMALPPNTRAEIARNMARLAVVRGQIEVIERTRRCLCPVSRNEPLRLSDRHGRVWADSSQAAFGRRIVKPDIHIDAATGVG
jgi:hypothetical protein